MKEQRDEDTTGILGTAVCPKESTAQQSTAQQNRVRHGTVPHGTARR